MQNPKTIQVTSRNEGTKNVEHNYYMVNAREKYQLLRRICDINPNIYGIIFCRTRRETSQIANKLMQDGYNADAIHGELSQSQRDYVMGRFRNKLELLVATDVAARGLDINELTHVINYNLPDDNEVYVHRSGRTGRAGNKGISIIIAHSREGRKLKLIEKMIKRKLIQKNIPSGEEICHIQLMKLIDNLVKTNINPDIDHYLPEIEEKLSHLDKTELIKHFISSEFDRFLSFYKNAPSLNTIKTNEKKKRQDRKTGHAESGYSRFFINLGKSQDLQTHNLIGLINEYTKNRNIPIGKIDIMRRFSFFEVPIDFESDILKGLSNAKWNGEKVIVEISKDPTKTTKKKNSKSISNNKTKKDKQEK